LYVYVINEANVSANINVFFDEMLIVHQKNNSTFQVTQANDYYPFGLTFNSYQADRMNDNKSPMQKNRYGFQNQELLKDLDLGWNQFKWRMHDPAVGRFVSVDPLQEKYMYNSPYAFSENKLTAGIELEGAEYLPTINKFQYKGTWTDYIGAVDNGVIDILNLAPTTWNSGVANFQSLARGTWKQDITDELRGMGKAIRSYSINTFNYIKNTPVNKQLTDAGGDLADPKTVETITTFVAGSKIPLGRLSPSLKLEVEVTKDVSSNTTKTVLPSLFEELGIDESIKVYHKGQLNQLGKSFLSTGVERESVEALERSGWVTEFKIPKDVFNSWKSKGFIQTLNDLDATTNVINSEVRFDAKIVPELMKYKTK